MQILFDRPLRNLPHLTPKAHSGFSDSSKKGDTQYLLKPFYEKNICIVSS